jgi:hypothetical protein
MTDVTPQTGRGLDRRVLLRNGLLAGAAVAMASVALPGITGIAQASTVEADAFGPLQIDVAFSAQNQWWWCRNCNGLFYSASGAATGRCPFGGIHDPTGSWMYETPFVTEQDAVAEEEQAQQPWRWCSWCTGLFWGKGQASSHCPGNLESFAPNICGPHNGSDGSYTYLLPYEGSEGAWSQGTPSMQAGWHWCQKCQGLFHPNSGTSGGLCPALLTKGPHDGGGTSYQLFVGKS